MEVILLDHIDKVGAKHDVVKVRDGFGRNYLIPQGLAIVANKANMARLEGLRKQSAKKEEAVVSALRETAAKLNGVTLKIAAKAGDSGRLFGSVTNIHIADALKAYGVDADKRIIEMPEEVKELGQYVAKVRFHPLVIVELPFDVLAEQGD
ncbi:MAG: 50S ribosomal protein L9 [Saprospiraceae bacterium]|jgi:large subunit ribosomal protein L9